jgi:uncharacterized membrane protein (UPF0136 family)
MRERLRQPVTLLSLVSALFALALLVDLHPYLRGGFGWRWPYNPIPVSKMALVAGLAVIYLVGGWLLRKQERLTVVYAFVGSIALTLAVVYGQHDSIGYTLFTRVASLVATGPHHAAAELDFMDLETLRTWDKRTRDYDPENETVSRHVLLVPPGIPIFYDLLNALLGTIPALATPMGAALVPYQCWNYSLLEYRSAEWASAWFGMLMPLWAALTVFPLAHTARRLNVPVGSVALSWALVPAIAAFAGSWNTFYPLLAVVAFMLVHHGLERGAPWLVGGGFVYGLSTFMNFAPVPFALVLGFYTLVHYWRHERGTRPLWRPGVVGLWVGLGALVPWAAWMLIGGPSPLAILDASFSIHLDLERAYLPWLMLHTYDWALYAGLPLVILSVAAAFRPRMAGSGLALALWLSIVVLVLSGTARGETARVWSFFTPFVLLSAAGFLREHHRWAVWAGTAALFVALTTTWDVFDAIDMKPLPDAPVMIADMQAANAVYDKTFMLDGWRATVTDNGIELGLNWQVTERATTPYWFSALWVGPDGTVAPESVIWQGGQTNYPTTCWGPGQLIGDQITLPLPTNAPDGDYWLSLAMFATKDAPQDRLPVTLADGTSGDQVGLGPVRVGSVSVDSPES